MDQTSLALPAWNPVASKPEQSLALESSMKLDRDSGPEEVIETPAKLLVNPVDVSAELVTRAICEQVVHASFV